MKPDYFNQSIRAITNRAAELEDQEVTSTDNRQATAPTMLEGTSVDSESKAGISKDREGSETREDIPAPPVLEDFKVIRSASLEDPDSGDKRVTEHQLPTLEAK
jgi:hypothetical protein